MATRCRWPPDSSRGPARRAASDGQRDPVEQLGDAGPARGRGRRRRKLRSGSSTISATDCRGSSERERVLVDELHTAAEAARARAGAGDRRHRRARRSRVRASGTAAPAARSSSCPSRTRPRARAWCRARPRSETSSTARNGCAAPGRRNSLTRSRTLDQRRLADGRRRRSRPARGTDSGGRVREQPPGVRRRAGAPSTCAVGPCSTIRPSFITTIRSARSAATPRSWVTSSTAVPSSRAQVVEEVEDAPLHGDVQGAGGLVGDDEAAGSRAMAMAMSTRCRMPPDSSCGYWRARSLRVGEPDAVEQLERPGAAIVRRSRAPVDAEHLADLGADRLHRVERDARVLRDQADPRAAHRLPGAARDQAGDVGAAEQDLAPRRRGRSRAAARARRAPSSTCPSPDSPTSATTSPGSHVEARRRARPGAPAARAVGDREVAYLEQAQRSSGRLPSEWLMRLAASTTTTTTTARAAWSATRRSRGSCGPRR